VNPKKRGRDETDPPVVLHGTLKKSYTMENPMLQGLEEQDEEQDMYADAGDNLWSANDIPEDTYKLLSLTQKPVAGKKKKNYKPEMKSTGFNILIGLLKFEDETKKKYATKKEIKQAIKNAKEELGDLLISNWTAMNTLIKYELVSNFQFSDDEKYSLTDLGFQTATDCFVKLVQEKENPEPAAASPPSNPSSTTAKDLKNPDAMNIENCSAVPTSNSNSNSATTLDSNSVGSENKEAELFDYSKFDFSKTVKKSQTKTVLKRSHTEEQRITSISSERKDENTVSFSLFERLSTEKEKTSLSRFKEEERIIQERIIEEKETPYKHDEKDEKETTEVFNHLVEKSKIIGAWSLVLFVDNREIRSKTERDFISEKFTQNGVNCRLVNLSLGDFLWAVEVGEGNNKTMYVLDYIIERKTADDLAASILDKRYNQQKFRLQNSNLKNIFYLVEGRVSQHSTLPQATVNKAVLNTQIVQNFKVRTTTSLQESIRLITEMHIAIESKFAQDLNNPSQDYTSFKYKFEEYQAVTSKSQGLTSKIHFGNMLRLIKGCGKECVSQILEKFDTLMDFYNALKKT